MSTNRNTSLLIAAGVAIIFGLLTVLSGGRALFGSEGARAAVGNAVPFVLWFNFLAGFVYILAGIGLYLRHLPAVWISIGIFATTFLVMLAFGLHMAQGGAYEMRTVGAMILRTTVWAAISLVAWKHIRKYPESESGA
ncbi:hypothetical protein [Litoreibacter arenae]|uniref:Uncharacterized protein n=1 Tax=Litoreibacter arenae DSM 19593 TaxID=1123360 RepID=S9Q8N5_9RHOB|nr:hypothetical protein [Litoreibacter arenae]EPX77736.1 hypothetical protein thalar_03461 [Litoreibacter arenae DSM 19593]